MKHFNFVLISFLMSSKRFRFTVKENYIIVQMVRLYGEDWNIISKQLPGRTPKQIHDRYQNYLRQGLKNSPWTSEEDEILMSMYKMIGPKWSKMMKNLPGRSSNDIKNRWHKHLIKKYNDKEMEDIDSKYQIKNNNNDQNSIELFKIPHLKQNVKADVLPGLKNFNVEKSLGKDILVLNSIKADKNDSSKNNDQDKNRINVNLSNKVWFDQDSSDFEDYMNDDSASNFNSLFKTDIEIQEIIDELCVTNFDASWK